MHNTKPDVAERTKCPGKAAAVAFVLEFFRWGQQRLKEWIYIRSVLSTYQGAIPGQSTFGTAPWFSSLLVAPGFSKKSIESLHSGTGFTRYHIQY
ncbi:hypothetical protein [Paenibacillus sp. FSL W7-1332]|uniref:hypothetical protein n=1 Tax=Paenibacillus sp. FSL W7-1332 TaxID=2921702 RepID=UPI0030D38B73